MDERPSANSTTPERPQPYRVASFLTPLMLFGYAMMAADFTAIATSNLHRLDIAYPAVWDVCHFIIPTLCGLGWMLSPRRWPNLSSIFWIVLCLAIIVQIPRFDRLYTTRLPTTRSFIDDEVTEMENRLGFKILSSFNSSDLRPCVVVAPAHAAAMHEELARRHLLIAE